MNPFDKIIDELGSSRTLFDNITPADPVRELLPHRNRPYIGGENDYEEDIPFERESDSDYSRFQPKERYKPDISDEELEMMAEHETDLLFTELEMYIGLGKGGFSELIITKDDVNKLHRYEAGERFDKGVIEEISQRNDIRMRFEQTEPSNRDAKKELLKKIIKADLLKKREENTLKLPSARSFIFRMLISEFSELTGRNYQIFSTIGRNIVSRIKG